MRISTAYPQQYNIGTMTDQQTKLNETQMKISSGKKYLTPSENPSAAAYSLSFKQSIDEATQYQNNIDTTNQRLSLEETTLASVTDTIQRLQELGLQGVSDSGNSTIARNAIASEFDQLNEHLLGLANTRNANGEYIFSGAKSPIMPFSKLDPGTQTVTATPLASVTTSENFPAQSWTKYVQKAAARDAYNYIVNVNPNGTAADAAAWATTQAAAYTTNGQAAAAAQTTQPASWQAAWDNTTTVFTDAFTTAFNAATKAGTTPTTIAHAAEAPLAEANVAASAAYDVYTQSLANYIPPVIGSATAATDAAAVAAAIADGTSVPATTAATPSAFIYSGSNTQRTIQIGSVRTIADGNTGIAVFGDPVTGQTLFDAVKNFSTELRADKPTLETLKKLDAALTQVSTARSDVGARQNALDRQKATNQDFIINNQTALSQVQDLDYAAAITQLNSQQTSLQAAQQSYAKVQSMTLFKYL